MKRRRFLQAATLGGIVTLSGCSALPFGNTQLPTDKQNQYLNHYPPASQVSQVSRVNIEYTQDNVYIRPVVYDDFETFVFFTVNKRGNGQEVARYSLSDYRNDDLKPITVSTDTVTGGTILLVVGETADGTRYTQTAVYYDAETEELVYPLAQSTAENNSTNTTS